MQKANLNPIAPPEVLPSPSSARLSLPASPLSPVRKSVDNGTQDLSLEEKLPKSNSMKRRLNDLYLQGRSLVHQVKNKHSRSPSGQSPVEWVPDIQPMEDEVPQQTPPFLLPTQAPRYPHSLPLFTLSDGFMSYVKQTPIESHSAREFQDYMRRMNRGQEKPITISDKSLSIYFQKTPVKYQSALGFLDSLKGGESPIEIGDDLLDNVIIPSIEQQMREFKKEYKNIDQLSPPFREYKPEDGALPEAVPLPPSLPPKNLDVPPLPSKTR